MENDLIGGNPASEAPPVPVGTDRKPETAESVDAKIEVQTPAAVQVPPEPEEEPDEVIAAAAGDPATPETVLAQSDPKPDYESLWASEKLAHDLTKLELKTALDKLARAKEMGFNVANIHRGA